MAFVEPITIKEAVENIHKKKYLLPVILYGQQRLTSLYIGLKGTYAYKMPRKRWDNDTAFPKRRLYLNLLGLNNDDDLEYNFKGYQNISFVDIKSWLP